MSDLDDVLNEEKQPVIDTPAPIEGEQPPREPMVSRRQAHRAKEDAARNPVVEEAPKEPGIKPEPPVTQPKQEFTDKERAFLAAAHEERQKRQALEKEFAEFKAKQAAAPQEPPKAFFDDPDGTIQRITAELAQTKTQFQQALEQNNTGVRVQMSEMMARTRHPDYQEKVTIFSGIVEKAPQLLQQVMASPDPAEAMYQLAKNHKDMQDAGSIDELRARIEKETRIKIEQEMKEKQELQQKQRDSLPPSLSQARSTAQNKVVWGGPTPLGNILND